jgi:hypothetical protein
MLNIKERRLYLDIKKGQIVYQGRKGKTCDKMRQAGIYMLNHIKSFRDSI